MAQFNFTIRATDNEGSYADRAFSINVKNSRVERYCVTDASDAYTSADGLLWTKRIGFGGAGGVAYGNNLWMAVENNFGPNTASVNSIKRSVDGVNWTTINSKTGATHVDTTGATVNAASRIVSGRLTFQNGFFFVTGYGSGITGLNRGDIYSARSSDGLSWTWSVVGMTGSTTMVTPTLGFNFNVTFNNGTYFINNAHQSTFNPAQNGTIGWKSSDGLVWTPMILQGVSTSTGYTWLGRMNGMYFATSCNVPLTGNSVQGRRYMWSVDGVNWSQGDFAANANNIGGQASGGIDGVISRTAPNQSYINKMLYANGTIYAFPARTAALNPFTYYYWTSVDGINWTWNGVRSFNEDSLAFQLFVEYKNGTLLMASNNGKGVEASIGAPQTASGDYSAHGGIRFSQTGNYPLANGNSQYTYGITPVSNATMIFTGVAIIG